MGLAAGGAPLNIANGIREFAIATPSAVAVVDGERSVTFAQLYERACRLANSFFDGGLAPGDRLGVIMGNRMEYCEIAAGLALAGMTMVPVNPRLTVSEVSAILTHSGAKGMILDEALSTIAAGWAMSGRSRYALSTDGTTLGANYENTLSACSSADPGIKTSEHDPFCIAYTSGTTEKPKGVMISHRSRCLTFYATALESGLGRSKRTIAVAPLYHGAAFAFGYGAVFVGGTLAMLRSFDARELLTLIAEFRPSSVFLVPTHAQMLREVGDDVIDSFDTSSLDTLYFNSDALPHPLKQWVRARFPGAGVHELYGSTEAGIVSNLRPTDKDKANCVGPPWFMTEVRVVDGAGNDVPPGQPGELFSRSPFLMNGYLDDDEATAACTTADGFLSSGDIAIRDEDNHLFIIDRKKDLVITGGVNVYPREVEDVLLRHEGVADVAVIGLTHDTWGEQVTACVVRARGADVGVAELETHCRAALAGFKVPRQFVFLDALPRNAAGKVLKRDLRLSVSLGKSTAVEPAGS